MAIEQQLPPTNSTIPSLKDIRKRLSKSSHVNGYNPQAVPQPAQPGTPDINHAQQTVTHIVHDGKTYSEAQLRYLTSEVKDYQITHGSLLKGVEYESESSVPARPVGAALLPTSFPKKCFDDAVESQKAYSELYMRVSSDPEWLHQVLEPLKGHDRLFTVLWEIYEKVRQAGALQNVICNVFRNDYMLHQSDYSSGPTLKQVEMNTFTCAGAAHAERIANMHHHLQSVRRLGDSPTSPLPLPPNTNVASIASMLARAHEIYTTTSAPTPRQKCILITVQPFNFNIADERPIELSLWTTHSIPTYRTEWRHAFARTTLLPDRTLLFSPPFGGPGLEVSVIYYRGGYVIEEYAPSGKDLRIKLEISRAIKCPDILTHMAGFKTVQAALTEPGAVERFLPPENAAKMRETFMLPMQVLDTSAPGLRAREMALDERACVNYVLKPNRDGGGHNVYRYSIPPFLRSKPEDSWHQYVLMRLIEPPPTTGTLMMPMELYHGPVICELGIVATCIWERKEGGDVDVKMNEVGGWTFKTKPKTVDEMSVVKGYGCFDCPLLIDTDDTVGEET